VGDLDGHTVPHGDRGAVEAPIHLLPLRACNVGLLSHGRDDGLARGGACSGGVEEELVGKGLPFPIRPSMNPPTHTQPPNQEGRANHVRSTRQRQRKRDVVGGVGSNDRAARGVLPQHT